MSSEDWHNDLASDIDPLKHAGESWYNTEEYATPDPEMSPHLQGEIGREGEYYPGRRRGRYTP